MSDFADNFRTLIDRRGWTQQQAADAIRVSQANVSRWLSAGHEPSTDVLMRIAAVFHVTVDKLLRGPGPSMPSKRSATSTIVWPARWFRQLRSCWHKYPRERHRMQTGIELAWPNQTEEIMAWLNQK